MKKVFLWMRWGLFLALWILGLVYGSNLYSVLNKQFYCFLSGTLKIDQNIADFVFYLLVFVDLLFFYGFGLVFFTCRIELPNYNVPFYSLSTFLPRLLKSFVVLLVCCLVLEGYMFLCAYIKKTFGHIPFYIYSFYPDDLFWLKVVIPWYYLSQEMAFLVAYLRTDEDDEGDLADSLKQTSDSCDA